MSGWPTIRAAESFAEGLAESSPEVRRAGFSVLAQFVADISIEALTDLGIVVCHQLAESGVRIDSIRSMKGEDDETS